MKLSMRESQILDLLHQGLSNKEIALHLVISPHTVRDHISDASRRHNIKGRVALATAYVRMSGAQPTE